MSQPIYVGRKSASKSYHAVYVDADGNQYKYDTLRPWTQSKAVVKPVEVVCLDEQSFEDHIGNVNYINPEDPIGYKG